MLVSCPAMPWPPRVLIVEDERIIAMSTSVNLRRMGCEVVDTVPTGAEAIAKAQNSTSAAYCKQIGDLVKQMGAKLPQ